MPESGGNDTLVVWREHPICAVAVTLGYIMSPARWHSITSHAPAPVVIVHVKCAELGASKLPKRACLVLSAMAPHIVRNCLMKGYLCMFDVV